MVPDYARINHVPVDVKEDWLRAAYSFVQSIQVYLRQREDDGLSDRDKEYAVAMPTLHDRLRQRMIERGFINLEAQRAAMESINAMLKAEAVPKEQPVSDL